MIQPPDDPDGDRLLRDTVEFCRQDLPAAREQAARQCLDQLARFNALPRPRPAWPQQRAHALQALETLGTLDLTEALAGYAETGMFDAGLLARGARRRLVANGLSIPMPERWGLTLLRLLALGDRKPVEALRDEALAAPQGHSHELAAGLLGHPPALSAYEEVLSALAAGHGDEAARLLLHHRPPQNGNRLDQMADWDRLAFARITGHLPGTPSALGQALLSVEVPPLLHDPLLCSLLETLAPETPWSATLLPLYDTDRANPQPQQLKEWEHPVLPGMEANLRSYLRRRLKRRSGDQTRQERQLIDRFESAFPEDDGSDNALDAAIRYAEEMAAPVMQVTRHRWMQAVALVGQDQYYIDRAALLAALLVDYSLLERDLLRIALRPSVDRLEFAAGLLPPLQTLQRTAALACLIEPWQVSSLLADLKVLFRQVHDVNGWHDREYRWMANACLGLFDLWDSPAPRMPGPALSEPQQEENAAIAPPDDPIVSESYTALLKSIEWRNMGEFLRWLPRAHAWRQHCLSRPESLEAAQHPHLRLVPWELLLAVKIMEERCGRQLPATGDGWLDRWIVRLRPHFHDDTPIMDPLASSWLELADWVGDLPEESPVLDLVIPLMRAANAR